MSFFSTAGPAIVRRPTPSSSRRMYARLVCRDPAARRAGRGRVPRRAPWRPRARCRAAPSPAPGRRSRRGGADGASARLPPRRRSRAPVRRTTSRGPARLRRAQNPADALLRRRASASVSASARSASTMLYPSSTSASRATTWVSPSVAVSGAATTAPSFSFSSSTIRSAVFLPMPGMAWKRTVSSRTIARRSSSTGEPETIASATFGPIPFTLSSWTNSSRSERSAKPYSCIASSRTWRYVSTVSSSAPSPLQTAVGVAATR